MRNEPLSKEIISDAESTASACSNCNADLSNSDEVERGMCDQRNVLKMMNIIQDA